MSTRSSARNLFPPLDNPELTIRRRSCADPTLLNNFEMAAEGNGDLPVPDLRTMEELCQPSLNGRGRTFMKRHPEECYDLIENMTAHHNDCDTSAQRSESSSSITSSSTEIAELKAEMAKINKNLIRVLQVNQQVKAVTLSCDTCGGPHSFSNCPATVGNTQNIYAAGAYQGGIKETIILRGTTKEETNSSKELTKENDVILKNMQTNMTSLTNSNLELKNMVGQLIKINTALSLGSGTLPGTTITNPKEELNVITTRSGTAYQGPMIPTTSSSLPLVVERETEATKDTVHPTNNGSTKDVQPLIIQTESPILNYEPIVAPIIEPVASPVSAPRPNQRPSIPNPSRFHDQKLHDKANDQRKKFFQIFKDLNFNISFADALILMPKTLLTNKDKLFELARTFLNEHCSAVLLKKFPEKLGDPGKFLIPCDFPKKADCLDLADLGASINLMPLSVWNKLSLPDLSPTCMTLELADRLISRSVGVVEDVFVKVGNYLPQVRKELKICEAKTDKSSIDEPPEVELKDLPPHLEYAFLEDDDKFPVIIAKDWNVEEKTALITVLKSHKRAIAWKLSNIKVLTLNFVLIKFSWRNTLNQRFNINEGSILKSTMSSRMRFLNSSMLA
nr:reverse transcriptase domain-containing protein [Tanacetum cinerariifolium]